MCRPRMCVNLGAIVGQGLGSDSFPYHILTGSDESSEPPSSRMSTVTKLLDSLTCNAKLAITRNGRASQTLLKSSRQSFSPTHTIHVTVMKVSQTDCHGRYINLIQYNVKCNTTNSIERRPKHYTQKHCTAYRIGLGLIQGRNRRLESDIVTSARAYIARLWVVLLIHRTEL